MRLLLLALLILGTAFTTAQADSQRPSTVSNVQASAISSSAIRLSWNAPRDNVGVDGYNIYRNSQYYSTVFNATNYIDTGLASGTRYDYAVVAFDRARNYSTMSSRSAASTRGGTASNTTAVADNAPPPPSANGTPAAPVNVRAEVLATDSIKLLWDAPGGSVSGYNVYRDGRYHMTVRDRTDYTASSLSAGREYRWRVVAFHENRYSLKSAELRVSTGSASAAPVATRESDDSNGVPDGYQLVFNDEFRDSSLNRSKWTSRYRWGPSWTINNEQQYYVDILNNPDFGHSPFSFDGEYMTISASKTPSNLKGWANNKNYLSGALTTYGKFKMRYGYVEMRARLPKGKGLWPAFWLLHNQENGRRPEIDVVEMLGDKTDLVYQTYHYYQNNRTLRSTPSYKVWGGDFSANFHTYGMQWEPGRITWYVDGQATNSYRNSSVAAEDMYLLLNLAVGGSWPGNPDGSTRFPATYTIDYIRAYSPD